MNGTADDDGYDGPATLVVGPDEFEVRVHLRGVFQPIDGRYHWYGRIERHEGLAAGPRHPTGGRSPDHARGQRARRAVRSGHLAAVPDHRRLHPALRHEAPQY